MKILSRSFFNCLIDKHPVIANNTTGQSEGHFTRQSQQLPFFCVSVLLLFVYGLFQASTLDFSKHGFKQLVKIKDGEGATICRHAEDTAGNCQRPVVSLGVSLQMHKITHLWKLSSIGRRSCEIWMKYKKHPCHTKLCAFILFLENYVTSEGAVSHNVLYYQPLPFTH